MAKWTGKRVGVSFNKPSEPSFLKEFKKRVGYKEEAGVRDKFAELPPATAEDLADDDEDLPQVVTGGGRNALSYAEYEALQQKGDLQQLLATGAADGGEGGSDGKIVFRRPASKRALEDKDSEEEEKATVDDRSTAELKDKQKKLKKKKKKHEEKTKKTLLSFDEDENDE